MPRSVLRTWRLIKPNWTSWTRTATRLPASKPTRVEISESRCRQANTSCVRRPPDPIPEPRSRPSSSLPSHSRRSGSSTTAGFGDDPSEGRRTRLLAARKLDGHDRRAPVELAGLRDELGGEPEGAVVRRVDAHARIIAPAFRVRLRPFARYGRLLDRHLVRRVACAAAGEADAGRNLRAGHAVTHQHVARLVHRDARHPSKRRVRRVCPLLEDRRRPTRVAQLVPAHPRRIAGDHRVIDGERLVVVEFSVGEPEHQPIAQRVERLRGLWLLDALTWYRGVSAGDF